ncbi:MAG: glycosyltransferase family 4 protein, partial [Planctomycetales bacterium]|nr:glycosyltransferase family 4 protein [Planctomycetales bacterium]
DAAGLAAAYRAASLTLLPSVADNFPFVALESFACRRPVVAFDVGGFGELVGKNERGTLVPAFDVDGMAAAINDFLADEADAEQRGAAAQRWVTEICDFDRYLERVVKAYDLAKQTIGRSA